MAKEAFEVGKIGTDLEILHSTLETLVAVIQVRSRLFTLLSHTATHEDSQFQAEILHYMYRLPVRIVLYLRMICKKC